MYPSLYSLKLDSNPLAEILPTDLEVLSKLEVLDLSGNASSLPEPSAISALPQLQELYLRRMKLHEFRNDLLGLKQLQILDLSHNSVTTVPEQVVHDVSLSISAYADFAALKQGIKDFTFLIELDLSDNNIIALPLELGLLESNLQVLKLDGNPLRSIRRTLLERGTKAILKYLKEKLPTE